MFSLLLDRLARTALVAALLVLVAASAATGCTAPNASVPAAAPVYVGSVTIVRSDETARGVSADGAVSARANPETVTTTDARATVTPGSVPVPVPVQVPVPVPDASPEPTPAPTPSK